MSDDITHICQENEFNKSHRIVRTTRFNERGEWFLQVFEPFIERINEIVRIYHCPFCGKNLDELYHIDRKIKKPFRTYRD